MESIVVDTNVLIAYLLESEEFHQRAQNHVDGLENGEYTFHLPMLVMVEVMATLNRRVRRNLEAIIGAWQQTMTDWEQSGKVILYPLDRSRMSGATRIAEQHGLRGADAIIAALSEELDMPLKTFDGDIRSKFQRASV